QSGRFEQGAHIAGFVALGVKGGRNPDSFGCLHVSCGLERGQRESISRDQNRCRWAPETVPLSPPRLESPSGDKFEEEESLHDAICILHARRSSLKRSLSAGQETTKFEYLKTAGTQHTRSVSSQVV